MSPRRRKTTPPDEPTEAQEATTELVTIALPPPVRARRIRPCIPRYPRAILVEEFAGTLDPVTGAAFARAERLAHGRRRMTQSA